MTIFLLALLLIGLTAIALAWNLLPKQNLESLYSSLIGLAFGGGLVWAIGIIGTIALQKEAMGFDHTEVAGWMCVSWKFPNALTQAIVNHHGSTEEGAQPLPAVVLAALIREDEGDADVEELVREATEHHGLAEDALRTMLTEALERAEDIAKMFA